LIARAARNYQFRFGEHQIEMNPKQVRAREAVATGSYDQANEEDILGISQMSVSLR
jgi:hypothetical protein